MLLIINVTNYIVLLVYRIQLDNIIEFKCIIQLISKIDISKLLNITVIIHIANI